MANRLEQERLQKQKEEEERAQKDREEKERITEQKEQPRVQREEKGFSYNKLLVVALVLGILLLGYWALAPGASNEPENPKITPATTPVPPKATNTPSSTPTKPALTAKNVDFAKGSKILEVIQWSKWPTVSNQYGHVGPDGSGYYVLEATSNTWMGPGSLMPINDLTGDFIIDIGFKITQKEACDLEITLSDYDTNYSRLSLYYLFLPSSQTFSIDEEWVENRFYVHTITNFADRATVPFDSSSVDWAN